MGVFITQVVLISAFQRDAEVCDPTLFASFYHKLRVLIFMQQGHYESDVLKFLQVLYVFGLGSVPQSNLGTTDLSESQLQNIVFRVFHRHIHFHTFLSAAGFAFFKLLLVR